MNTGPFRPERVFVRKDCLSLALTGRILERLPGVPVEVVRDEEAFLEAWSGRPDPVGEGKRTLLLTRSRGAVVKPCPCTSGYVGCNYFIINADTHCPLDCSYCILQNYLSRPLVTAHVDRMELERQIRKFFKTMKKPLRIGTGELGDSLVLDHLTDRSIDLIRFFREHPQALLELKTKTVNIGNLLEERPAENVIIAWSLNAESVARTEESGAPSPSERIRAASKIQSRGYRVAFHFDPLVLFDGWEEEYRLTVTRLFDGGLDPSRIGWISLGALRFPPDMKGMIRKRFPDSRILTGEMIRGLDGKFRYFRPLRAEMFKKLSGFLRESGGEGIPLYLCMESPWMWRNALGKKIRGKEQLGNQLSLPLVSSSG